MTLAEKAGGRVHGLRQGAELRKHLETYVDLCAWAGLEPSCLNARWCKVVVQQVVRGPVTVGSRPALFFFGAVAGIILISLPHPPPPRA